MFLSKINMLEIVGEKGVRVLDTGKKGFVTIPTTEELAAYIHEPQALHRIEVIQEDALQRAEVGI